MEQTSAPAKERSAQTSDWDRLVDQYFDDYYFPFHPTSGTHVGFHRYDSQLEDYSRAGVEAEIKSLKQARTKIEGFSAKGLSADQQGDRELLLHAIDSRLLDLEQIRQWEKNPDHYTSGITYSVFLIISRKFAPPAERLRSLVARERQMPKVFEAGRANLKNPPKIYTQITLQQLPGIIRFFQQDVPAAFQKEVKDRKLLDEFHESNQAVIDGLSAYQKWLKEGLLPHSNGDFRIGAENYRKKLLYDEMVDTPLDELLKLGCADLHRNQQWLKETAARIDPSKTPQQVLAELQKNYPPPQSLLQTVRDMFGDLRGFIERAHIVTIPSPVLPIVEETPPFMRALTFASMDTPGPYEHTKEAFFNVTLPEKDWSPEHVREFMAQFNYDTLTSVATHEAYPGHYVQFLWVQNAPSKVRKLVGAGSNAEGWAHYCEQMMLDEGYGKPAGGGGDDRYLKLRLGQLQDALLRDARYIVGIEMHTGKMTFEQAADFFVKEGYQTRAVGETETKRGTSNPTYLVYTLGKLEILKLREDYRQKMGANFNLEEFHDQFLKQGFPPVKIIRKAMLGDDSPVL